MNEEVLKNHPCKIWQGYDGNWYTYVETANSGLRCKTRATREEMITYLTGYYRRREKNITLLEVASRWRKEKAEKENLTPEQAGNYEKITNWMFSYIGNTPMRKITRSQVEDLLRDSVTRCTSMKQETNFRIILAAVLDYAGRHNLLTCDISDLFPKPHQKSGKHYVLNEFQCKTVVTYLRSHYKDLVDLVLLLIFYANSLTIGEILGLRPCDVDGEVLHVRQYLVDSASGSPSAAPINSESDRYRDIRMKRSQLWLFREIRRMRSEGDLLFQLPEGTLTGEMIETRLEQLFRHLNLDVADRSSISKPIPLKKPGEPQVSRREGRIRTTGRPRGHLHIVK